MYRVILRGTLQSRNYSEHVQSNPQRNLTVTKAEEPYSHEIAVSMYRVILTDRVPSTFPCKFQLDYSQ